MPFYGHMNSTVANDNAWKYFEDEIVNRCFKVCSSKFVRIFSTRKNAIGIFIRR